MTLKLEHKKDFILSEYAKDPNIARIAKLLGEYQQPVAGIVKKYLGLKSLLPSKGNTQYFSNIDSHSKAYIVGFIAADGSLVTNNNSNSIALSITVKHTDVSILEFIKSQIGNEHEIKHIHRAASYDPTKQIHHVRYLIADKQIASDLMKLGVEPKKTHTLRNIIENIPYEYRDSFILGYFDGDGSVSTINTTITKFNKTLRIMKTYPCHNLSVSIRGTQDFLTGVCNHLQIKNSFIKQYDSIPSLTFGNKKDILRLYDCYKNLDFYLERKHSVFMSRINHSSYDKYK